MSDFAFNTLQDSIRKNSNYWKRYDDILNSLTQEQKIFVSKQENVLNAKQSMLSAFMDYLFFQHKDAFVSVADGKYKEIVDLYIKEIQKAADSYVSRSEQLEKENAELREKLTKLLGDKNDKMAAGRSGSCRKGSPKKTVSSGNDTRTGCNAPTLFETGPEQIHPYIREVDRSISDR